DHLGADEDVDLARVERGEDTLNVMAAAHGIAIEARDTRAREHPVQRLFQPLGAAPEELHVLAAAFRARLRHGTREAAIVALESARALVVGERDGAILALDGL